MVLRRKCARRCKGTEMNKSLESTLGFGLNPSVSIEQSHRHSNSYDEDFVIEKRMKVA